MTQVTKMDHAMMSFALMGGMLVSTKPYRHPVPERPMQPLPAPKRA